MRIVIKGDPISVVCGVDQMTGVFLAVHDKRLEYDPESTAEVNKVTESIGIGDGGGSYLNLHTGVTGFGSKVDDKTMLTYLQRFGVPDDKIRELGLQTKGLNYLAVQPGTSTRKVGSPKVCNSCRNKSSCSNCSSCHSVAYCCRECQRSDWPIHKLFCGLKVPDGADAGSAVNTRVKVFVFPEGSPVPEVRYLILRNSELDFTGIIPGFKDKISSDLFTDINIRQLPSAYDVVCKDDSSVDGTSKMNQCILNLFRRWEKKIGSDSIIKDSFWRNNIVVVKRKPGYSAMGNKVYEDISSADATEVVKFLYRYTSQKCLFTY